MRLSEILKNTPGHEVLEKPAAPIAQRVKPASPPPPRPAKAVSAAPQKPAVNVEALEKTLRNKLEEEFRSKMQQMESEIQKRSSEMAQQENQLAAEKEKIFRDEIQKLQSLVQDLRKKNETISADTSSRQAEESKAVSSLQQMMEAFQKKMEQKEQELREREAKFEKEMESRLAKKDDIAEQKILEEKQDEVQAELEKKLIEKEEELKRKDVEERLRKLSSLPSDVPFPPPAAVPVPVPSVPLLRPADPNESPLVLLDSQTELKIRALYEKLNAVGQPILDELAAGKTPDLQPLVEALADVADYLIGKHADMMWLSLEPYPTMDYFIYHCTNCALLALGLGSDLNLNRDKLIELGLSAFLHDVGLLKIKENLDYPKELTPESQKEVLKHAERSAEMVALCTSVNETVLIGIRQHHETCNGKGYPQGLEAKDIHLYARILHCVDSFEAMTHYRPYRKKPMDVSSAIKEMIEGGRGIYDRDVIKALMNQVGLYPVMALVELSNKQVARVIKQNKRFPLSPVVRIEFDEAGNKLKTATVMDLTQNQLIHINGLVGASPSYAKERLDSNKKVVEKKKESFMLLREIIPIALMLSLLGVLIYIVLKL